MCEYSVPTVFKMEEPLGTSTAKENLQLEDERERLLKNEDFKGESILRKNYPYFGRSRHVVTEDLILFDESDSEGLYEKVC